MHVYSEVNTSVVNGAYSQVTVDRIAAGGGYGVQDNLWASATLFGMCYKPPVLFMAIPLVFFNLKNLPSVSQPSPFCGTSWFASTPFPLSKHLREPKKLCFSLWLLLYQDAGGLFPAFLFSFMQSQARISSQSWTARAVLQFYRPARANSQINQGNVPYL